MSFSHYTEWTVMKGKIMSVWVMWNFKNERSRTSVIIMESTGDSKVTISVPSVGSKSYKIYIETRSISVFN